MRFSILNGDQGRPWSFVCFMLAKNELKNYFNRYFPILDGDQGRPWSFVCFLRSKNELKNYFIRYFPILIGNKGRRGHLCVLCELKTR
jgi:hypothetical protein